MKLNLGCGADYRPDHIHIDLVHHPAIPPGDFKQGDVANLDWACHDGEADEILAVNILQYLPYPIVAEVLRGWIKKLRQGGVIRLEVPDLSLITKAFLTGSITFGEAMVAIYGEVHNSAEPFHRAGFECRQITSLLTDSGMAIQRISYNGMGVCLEAVKS